MKVPLKKERMEKTFHLLNIYMFLSFKRKITVFVGSSAHSKHQRTGFNPTHMRTIGNPWQLSFLYCSFFRVSSIETFHVRQCITIFWIQILFQVFKIFMRYNNSIFWVLNEVLIRMMFSISTFAIHFESIFSLNCTFILVRICYIIPKWSFVCAKILKMSGFLIFWKKLN